MAAHPDWAVRLDVQRRMHASIAAFSAGRFYEGALAPGSEDHPPLGGVPCAPPPSDELPQTHAQRWRGGARVLFVDVATEEERRGTSWQNPAEAAVVCDVVRRLACRPADVGVI